MEVASPVSFAHEILGSKRRYASSPILDSTATAEDHDFQMDDSAAYGQNFKRRRYDHTEIGLSQPSFNYNHSPLNHFSTLDSPVGTSPFGGNSTVIHKRQRSDDAQIMQSKIKYMESIIENQSQENQHLRSQKESIEASFHQLSAKHEKVLNENKNLKKILSIKQERQDQFVAELDELRRYKAQSEHALTMLRHHLSSQHLAETEHFGGFGPGNPHIY